ncbi:MAG: hypothetical protein [Caudoviricetes sp.]|nr:MAG: hypothetical protein [Caudoviricetes sp.]
MSGVSSPCASMSMAPNQHWSSSMIGTEPTPLAPVMCSSQASAGTAVCTVNSLSFVLALLRGSNRPCDRTLPENRRASLSAIWSRGDTATGMMSLTGFTSVGAILYGVDSTTGGTSGELSLFINTPKPFSETDRGVDAMVFVVGGWFVVALEIGGTTLYYASGAVCSAVVP